MRKLFLATACFVVLLAVPFVSKAAWDTVWQLPNGVTEKQLAADNAQLSAVAGGVRVQSNPNGGVGFLLSISHRIDGIRIVFSQTQAIPVLFVWHKGVTPRECLSSSLCN